MTVHKLTKVKPTAKALSSFQFLGFGFVVSSKQRGHLQILSLVEGGLGGGREHMGGGLDEERGKLSSWENHFHNSSSH